MTDELKAPERTFDHPYELSHSDGEWWTLKSNGFVVASFSLKTWGSAERIIEAAWQYAYGQPDADRITTLEAEIKMLTRAGIIEVAIRNPSVADYMHHWESRAEKAEAALADMTQQRDAAMAGAVRWQWRSRIKGGLWDSWENGRYGQDKPPFMDIEERILPDPDRMLALTAAAYEDAGLAVANIETGHHDGISGDWHPNNPLQMIRDACAAIRNRIPADAIAALSRIEAQSEARGMRICADIYYTRCCADDDGDDVYREMMSSADATEAAAKGGV